MLLALANILVFNILGQFFLPCSVGRLILVCAGHIL